MGTKISKRITEAERSLLGACLVNPDGIFAAQTWVRGPEDFGDVNNATVWDAMSTLASRNKQIDIVLLSEQLRRLGELEQIGGITFLADLAGSVPTSAHLEDYARSVREAAMLRRLQITTRTLAAKSQKAEDAREFAMTCLSSIQKEINDKDVWQVSSPKTLAEEHRKWLTSMKGTRDLGMATGIHELDQKLHYGMTDEIVVLAARPSVGKTALMLTLADHVAAHYGGVYVVSAETSARKLMERLNAIVCPHDQFYAAAREGRKERANLMEQYLPVLEGRPIYIDDRSRYIEDVVWSVRAHCARQPDTKLVCIDFLQELDCRQKVDSERAKYNAIVSKISALRNTIQRPIVLLSQLSRAQFNEDSGPFLWHLKETSNIEQAADIVIMLWTHEKEPNLYEENIRVKIAKQRDGPRGTVKDGLRFLKVQTLFVSPTQGRSVGDEQQTLDAMGEVPF